MKIITTHQKISLTSITYTVCTSSGRHLGQYTQQHGADTVTSPQLEPEDNGIVGAIEAIAIIAHNAGIRGFQLSEESEKTYTQDLVDELLRRVEVAGGLKAFTLTDIFIWGR